MKHSQAPSFAACMMILVLALHPCAAQDARATPIPSAQEIADLLQKEPMTVEGWPKWRGRLLDWIADRTRRTDAAFDAARGLMLSQADAQGNLPPVLAGDHLAWYFLGSAYEHDRRNGFDLVQAGMKAEKAQRKSLELNQGFARAHRNLAMAMLMQTGPGLPNPRAKQIDEELEESARLDRSLPLNAEIASVAFWRKQFGRAEQFYQKAMRDFPEEAGLALQLAYTVVQNPSRTGPRSRQTQPLADKFPANGDLACLNGVALAQDNRFGAAYRELERSRTLGANPEKLLGQQTVRDIETRGAPGLLEHFGWTMLYFAGFYAAVMLVMAFAGLLLAGRTRGRRALGLLEARPEHLVDQGQVVRVSGETMLARLYALALCAGLILFYLAIPFVIVGLVGTTALLIYLIFLGGHIPIKLVVIILVFGLGAAWAVLKSLFTKAAAGGFGLVKTPTDCPRLHQVIGDVARRVDTDPVHEVYVAPGSQIGVHQQGRGPFGVFGVKRRVLTLGLSTMRFLTVTELEAILAHEYAHFSHRDTFYSRFIYQVHMSIGQALWGMGQAGGYLNYVNPFYWFLFLYYKSYSLLSAGFSRSREFLADRMASSLYGSDVFADALVKVSTDGTLFEKTIYGNIAHLLQQQQAFVNMYESFQQYRDEQLTKQERDEEFQKLLAEKGSLFAQHPTVAERLEAVAELPPAEKRDATPALQLFENPEETEKELTQFLTDYICALQQLQAQAAAAAG
jgi:Zn-dependent protease with chaperone function